MKDYILLGNVSTTTSSKQFLLSLAKQKLFYTVNTKEYLHWNNILTMPLSKTTQRPLMVCSTILAVLILKTCLKSEERKLEGGNSHCRKGG